LPVGSGLLPRRQGASTSYGIIPIDTTRDGPAFYTRTSINFLALKIKKCSIKHQKSTINFIIIAAKESLIFIHLPKLQAQHLIV
jgi:hypothetical protein